MAGPPSHADHDAWVAGVQADALRQRAEVYGAPPFVVAGLSSPALTPFQVGAVDHVDDEWRSITLFYGDPAGSPFISVRTTTDASDAGSALAGATGDGVEAAGTAALLPFGPVTLTSTVRAWADREWAAHTDVVPGVDVVVAARGVAIGAVHLARVDDLSPYWPRYWHTHRPPVPLAAGLRRQRCAVDAALRSERPDRPRLGRRGWLSWRRGIAAHRALRGGDRAAAQRCLTEVYGHCAQLRAVATWFADAALRARAIDETLRFATYDAEVASGAAQRAWPRAGSGPAARAVWEREWQRWADSQAG